VSEKPIEKIDASEIIALAHRWQEFRKRCLKFAFKAGATENNMTEVADRIGEYILKPSGRELTAQPSPNPAKE
jgi:hypothetical protein